MTEGIYNKILNNLDSYEAYKEEIDMKNGLNNVIKWADNNNIPESIVPRDLYKLQKVETLVLDKLNIKELPNDIEKLINLTELSIKDCDLRTLPSSICKLTKLKYLNLMYNYHLNNLPECISNLKNLEKLTIDETNIIKLPESFGNLKKLIFLGISNLKLKYVPSNIKQLNDKLIIRLKIPNNRTETYIGKNEWVHLMLKENKKDKIKSFFFYKMGIKLYI